jgi:dihydroxyacetone kinase-like protein
VVVSVRPVLEPRALHCLIEAVAGAVIGAADELTALDQAIGDGDHGVNMKRGFEAVHANAVNFSEKPLPEALRAIGSELVMKVGGASGPLYGTLFMSFGKSLAAGTDLAAAFAQAVDAVKARGKSQEGQKTMLDVLVPTSAAIAKGGDLIARLPRLVADAAEATVPMRAVRGRASFLGERSIGHMDPGARSASLMIAAACRALESAHG